MSRVDQSDIEFWRDVGRRYRVARLALGLTVEQAATAAGVTVRTWRKWENNGPRYAGHLGPLDFAARFDVSIGWLFCGRGVGIGRHLSQQTNGAIAILPRGEGCPIPKAVLRERTPSKVSKRRSASGRTSNLRSPSWAIGRNGRKARV
jgi:transcriptional regulator with XRE-family HTH domain